MSGYKHLRVEESKVTPVTPADTVPFNAAPKLAVVTDVEHWRRMAIDAGKRLEYAETQLKDLRVAADDARARFGKYKDRLDKANEKVNELTIQLVSVTADRDDLRGQVATQEVIARKLHEYRQSLLNGPIWDLFVELAVSPPKPAGVESDK